MSRAELRQLRQDVARAATVVAPSWPLASAIAVNPLSGFEDRPVAQGLDAAAALFGAAVHLPLAHHRARLAAGELSVAGVRAVVARRLGRSGDPAAEASEADALVWDLVHGPEEPPAVRTRLTAAELHDRRTGGHLAAEVDERASSWCLAWCATAPWSVDAGQGLWAGWRRAVLRPGQLPRAPRARLAELGERADHALLAALALLGVPAEARVAYLEAHVAALPGWFAHLRWRAGRDAAAGTEVGAEDPVLDLLALRVALEAALLPAEDRATWPAIGEQVQREQAERAERHLAERVQAVAAAGAAAALSVDELRAVLGAHAGAARALLWQEAAEEAARQPLLAAIAAGPSAPASAAGERPAAQSVWCIDVRSERMRRHLEALGRYETFGYAGFFGLPVRIRSLGAPEGVDQLPVLLAPAAEVVEVAAPGAEADAEAAVAAARRAAATHDAWYGAKHAGVAPLALAEAAGWVLGPAALARSAAPGASEAVRRTVRRARRQHHHADTCFDASELPVDARVQAVRALLVATGLGRNPAPLVLLCGHGSRADGNPFESAYACGACGGQAGGANARILAQLANDPEVRAALAADGIDLPADTWFVAAQHDTATDVVTVLDRHLVPSGHQRDLATLERALAEAGRAAVLDRSVVLPGVPVGPADDADRRVRRVRTRAADWAEPVAELGLAGNHAFVIGPRALTAGVDLGGRVFLHSYDAAADPTGAVLAGILTAPVVVAQWINAQYHFSTLDPERFGSGSKALHNVVGTIGVLSGPGGDLRRGLPLQAVRAGDRLLHEPLRLLVVAEARPEHVEAAVAGSTLLQDLLGHEWIALAARAPGEAAWQRWTAAGWSPWATPLADRPPTPTTPPTHRPEPELVP